MVTECWDGPAFGKAQLGHFVVGVGNNDDPPVSEAELMKQFMAASAATKSGGVMVRLARLPGVTIAARGARRFEEGQFHGQGRGTGPGIEGFGAHGESSGSGSRSAGAGRLVGRDAGGRFAYHTKPALFPVPSVLEDASTGTGTGTGTGVGGSTHPASTAPPRLIRASNTTKPANTDASASTSSGAALNLTHNHAPDLDVETDVMVDVDVELSLGHVHLADPPGQMIVPLPIEMVRAATGALRDQAAPVNQQDGDAAAAGAGAGAVKVAVTVLLDGLVTPVGRPAEDLSITSPWTTVGDELALALLRARSYDCRRALREVMVAHLRGLAARGIALLPQVFLGGKKKGNGANGTKLGMAGDQELGKDAPKPPANDASGMADDDMDVMLPLVPASVSHVACGGSGGTGNGIV